MYRKFMQQILEGTKTITIRDGHRDIKLGPLVFRATKEDHPDILVKVTGCKHCTMQEIDNQLAQADGFENVAAFQKEMEQIYVRDLKRYDILTKDHPITVVSFVPCKEKE